MRISIIKNEGLKKTLITVLVAIFWIAVWQGIYLLVSDDLIIASPMAVLNRIFVLGATKDFWLAVLYSVLRILLGFISGVVFGVLMASLCASRLLNQLFAPIILLIRATPVASFIMLTWLWLKRDSIPVFVSFLMVVPIVWGNVATGIKGVGKEYKDFAKMYKITGMKKIKYLFIPSVLPHFASAVFTSAGLVWKAGVAAEVLCQPKISIGSNLFDARSFLDTLDVFVWTAVIIIISLILEKIIKTLLKQIEKKFAIAGLT
ncbi:MAG: ABC transporter permease subunit [Clostridia bacterium]|nr:ABC transporter permease subunit [Clostridia bacterium]